MDTVRPYFRSIAEAQGFTEWPDAFNFQNIPDTLVDDSFHLGPVDFSITALDHRCISFSGTINVKLFFKGYREPATAMDEAMTASKAFLRAALKPATRTSGETLKNVRMNSLQTVPLGDSNDNGIRIDFGFGVDLILDLEEGP